MGSPKIQDFKSVSISKNKSHRTCKLNNSIGKLATFLRRCHMDESTALAEKKKKQWKEKSRRKYTMMHLG